MSIIERKGFVQAMSGEELWVNTQTDEIVKIVVKDPNVRKELYCKYVKISVDIIDEEDLDDTKSE
jgi:hypothetical protein